MPTSVLLSVKPEFARAIFAGTKTYEFRRALFISPDVARIVVYASSPLQRVIGDFRVDRILSMSPKDLWLATHHGAGITQDYFKSYFRGRSIGHAIEVHEPRRFSRSRRLTEHYGLLRPPQSFCYLD
ncbi:MAG: hypothetical protein H0W69_08060 [Gemmatimonadaceae bacterium]|nr:hypothetical protein [Gemmatimonadaceae bacterium]